MDKGYIEIINVIFKNLKSIPKMLYISGGIVLLIFSYAIFYFKYTGVNTFYNFFIILGLIFLTGLLFLMITFTCDKITNYLWRLDLLNNINAFATEEKLLLKRFIDESATTINIDDEELDYVRTINSKINILGYLENGLGDNKAMIAHDIYELIKNNKNKLI